MGLLYVGVVVVGFVSLGRVNLSVGTRTAGVGVILWTDLGIILAVRMSYQSLRHSFLFPAAWITQKQ